VDIRRGRSIPDPLPGHHVCAIEHPRKGGKKGVLGGLGKGNGKFLVSEGLTAADTMVAFSVQFIFARKLGAMGKR